MGNVYKPVDQSVRLKAEYSEARSLLEQKCAAMTRVVEIDRALRELRDEDPEGVEAARVEIPFRGRHGSARPGKRRASTGASIATPVFKPTGTSE